VLIDNGSTYQPLLDFYSVSDYTIKYLDNKYGQTAPWSAGVIEEFSGGGYYVVTDSDVVPVEECPLHVLDYFRYKLDKYEHIMKIGFGLRTDDLPAHYKHADAVRIWEEQFSVDQIEPGLFAAELDTTFAMYKPVVKNYPGRPSIRTGAPYIARHMPWYTNSNNLSDEDKFYQASVNKSISTWNDELPDIVTYYINMKKSGAL
jgi:hypothetical protein